MFARNFMSFLKNEKRRINKLIIKYHATRSNQKIKLDLTKIKLNKSKIKTISF